MQRDEATDVVFTGYRAKLGKLLRTRRQRELFAFYAAGFLGDSPRKSCEPIASLGGNR